MVEFVIRSSRTGARIRFSARRDLYFHVLFDSPEVRSGKTVYGHLDHRGLVAMFEAMAKDWRGWQGPKTWTSLESDMELTAMHDGLGHISLDLHLVSCHPQEEQWETRSRLVVDAGQLDRLAFDLRRFFA